VVNVIICLAADSKVSSDLSSNLSNKGNTAKVTISLTRGVLRAYCNLMIKQGAEDENPEWIIPEDADYLQMRTGQLSAMWAGIS
jgi:hypothetical protein